MQSSDRFGLKLEQGKYIKIEQFGLKYGWTGGTMLYLYDTAGMASNQQSLQIRLENWQGGDNVTISKRHDYVTTVILYFNALGYLQAKLLQRS